MKTEDIVKIYEAGNANSHEDGLRAVFDAGVASLEKRVDALENGQVLFDDEVEDVEDEK